MGEASKDEATKRKEETRHLKVNEFSFNFKKNVGTIQQLFLIT